LYFLCDTTFKNKIPEGRQGKFPFIIIFIFKRKNGMRFFVIQRGQVFYVTLTMRIYSFLLVAAADPMCKKKVSHAARPSFQSKIQH